MQPWSSQLVWLYTSGEKYLMAIYGLKVGGYSHSLYIDVKQTNQGQQWMTFCLLPHCWQTQIEWRYSSKLSLKSSDNWVITFRRATWLPLWFWLMSIHRERAFGAGASAAVWTLPVSPVCLAALCYQPIHTPAWERQRGLDMINQLTDQRA